MGLPRRAPHEVGHWTLLAACRAHPDPDIFMPDTDEPQEIQEYKTHQAKSICHQCPVRIICREYAMASPIDTYIGIWGGLTVEERANLRAYRRHHPGQGQLEVM